MIQGFFRRNHGGRKDNRPWLRREALADIIQWDVATWRPALDLWDRKTEITKDELALEIGSRDGGLSLFLAMKGCRVVCSDVQGPTHRAREVHRKYEYGDRISYACVDATAIPFTTGHFDLVALKSVLGALGNVDSALTAQRTAVREIHRVLKPGGRFLFAENMRGSWIHGFMRERCVPWGRRWHYFSENEIVDLLSCFSTLDLSFGGFAATLGRREWQRSLLYNVDRGLVPLLPRGLRYVVFGFAVK